MLIKQITSSTPHWFWSNNPSPWKVIIAAAIEASDAGSSDSSDRSNAIEWSDNDFDTMAGCCCCFVTHQTTLPWQIWWPKQITPTGYWWPGASIVERQCNRINRTSAHISTLENVLWSWHGCVCIYTSVAMTSTMPWRAEFVPKKGMVVYTWRRKLVEWFGPWGV